MLHHAGNHLRSASAASFVRLAKHRAKFHRPPPSLSLSHSRWQTTTVVADAQASGDTFPQGLPKNLAKVSRQRFNEIDVQQISEYMYDQIFKEKSKPPPEDLVDLSRDHLERHNLLGKNTDNSAPIAFDIPEIHGKTLDEHFYKLGTDCAEPYLRYAKQFAIDNAPPRPLKWARRSGWTRYPGDDSPQTSVEAPEEDVLCFDVEVMWKESPFAVMACAMSAKAWYVWLSPWLLGESESMRHLIPLGDPSRNRVIVGHNIGYDRARILEEYDLVQTKNAFLDTMSLHVAVNGMCSQQRPTWIKHQKSRELRDKLARESQDLDLAELLASDSLRDAEEDLWIERSSINSLRDVAKFHLRTTIDKEVRNDFGELSREQMLKKLDDLINYCAADVAVTHRVYKIVFPHFLEVCPHPVSFAALRHLSSVILPVNETWENYIKKTEETYRKLSAAIQERLIGLAEKAVELRKDEKMWKEDPWLKQLDWSGQEVKYAKGKRKNDPPRLALRQKKPGMPKWYKGLFPTSDEECEMALTVRSRIAPLLLRLSWDGYPLFWSDSYGWTFRVPIKDSAKYTSTQLVRCDMTNEPIDAIKNDWSAMYFKLPHKDGPTANCGNPMAKSYIAYFEKGTLSSEYPYAKEALHMNASCSYWISARDRIMSQMVVYESDKDPKTPAPKSGYILPQVIPMGTITRRAVEKTWLTASNAKKNRVGSELKAMIRAPPGYSFVGADVDSEELWIASVIGDATFQLHGGNAIGFMTLEGTKSAGTDLHSRTASILGITRNDAKVFNYGRIYGAGLKFASTLLRQFNPGLSEQETTEVAARLYTDTKGAKTTRKTLHNRPFWRGGTESFVFNKLEEFAEQERPRTPVLGAGITEALMNKFISKGAYLTSRINWAIQSSGVDYLHLLIVAMDYLIRRFNLNARLAITVHDEIRYLVKDDDKYRAAMALQVSNIWTRAMFAQQVGINDLPQSCAYFSAVDIDHILRKEVDMDCVTPSHSTPIPAGESIDITQLLGKGDAAFLDPSIEPKNPPRLDNIQYTPRVPVMRSLGISERPEDLSFIKAQITNDDAELREILREQKLASAVETPKKESTRKSRAKKEKNMPYSSKPQLIPHLYPVFKAAPLADCRYEGRQMGGDQSHSGWSFEVVPPQ